MTNIEASRDMKRKDLFSKTIVPGYKVVYPDGYVSWCPKETMDRKALILESKTGSSIWDRDVERWYSKFGNVIGGHIFDNETTKNFLELLLTWAKGTGAG